MPRVPPTSTLFPTRRSSDLGDAQQRRLAGTVVAHDGRRAAHRDRQDRKSTRLNSSHANISYAVFCLKKKEDGPRDRRIEGVMRHRIGSALLGRVGVETLSRV